MPEFRARDPYCRGRRLTPRCPLTSTHTSGTCAHTCAAHTDTQVAGADTCTSFTHIHTSSTRAHTCTSPLTCIPPTSGTCVHTCVSPNTHKQNMCSHMPPPQAVHVFTHAHPSHTHTHKWHVLTMCAPQHQTQVAHRQPEREEEAGFSSQECASLPRFEIRYLGGWCCAHI